jgi:cell pole-organizing protein PopZ
MLQGWLDDKLPEILERLVRAELARALGEIAPG